MSLKMKRLELEMLAHDKMFPSDSALMKRLDVLTRYKQRVRVVMWATVAMTAIVAVASIMNSEIAQVRWSLVILCGSFLMMRSITSSVSNVSDLLLARKNYMERFTEEDRATMSMIQAPKVSIVGDYATGRRFKLLKLGQTLSIMMTTFFVIQTAQAVAAGNWIADLTALGVAVFANLILMAIIGIIGGNVRLKRH